MFAVRKIAVFGVLGAKNTFCTKWSGVAGSGLLALGFGKIGLWAEGETGKDGG